MFRWYIYICIYTFNIYIHCNLQLSIYIIYFGTWLYMLCMSLYVYDYRLKCYRPEFISLWVDFGQSPCQQGVNFMPMWHVYEDIRILYIHLQWNIASLAADLHDTQADDSVVQRCHWQSNFHQKHAEEWVDPETRNPDLSKLRYLNHLKPSHSIKCIFR